MQPPRFFKRVRATTPENIMLALADFAVQVPVDQEIVEIGVFHGRTTLQLAWGARQGQRAHVTAVDPWDLEGNTYGPPFTDPSARRWAHHHVKALGYAQDITLVQAFSVDAAAQYDGPPVGLLFVDGDHSKEGCRQDIEAWAPHLAEGARIAIDDYGHPDWPGVREAVDELVTEGCLEPVEVFHDALAVTRLTARQEWAVGGIAAQLIGAITSEGVHPSPKPLKLGDEDAWSVDAEVSSQAPPLRAIVHDGELDGVAEGTPIMDLTIPQMKALARRRNIILGVRKDKRELIVQALLDGK